MDPSFFDVSLDELGERVWSALARAAADASHDWHWPTVSTVAEQGPRARTVVLREASAPHLVFHTDIRTPKVSQLEKNPRTEWHFYDSGSRVQVRARGVSRIRTDVGDLWEDLPPASRANYCARLAPGTAVEEPIDGLEDERREPDLENTTHGRENFAVIETTVQLIDWLWLADGRHRRARFNLEEESSTWLIP